jgi:DNA-directed RNA polymerase subunit RPC12/RpoP
MEFSVSCDRCHSKAIIIRHVSRPSELAEIAEMLDLDDVVDPYMIIGCPKCGIRIIDPPSSEPTAWDRA